MVRDHLPQQAAPSVLLADMRRMIKETCSAITVTVNVGLTVLNWRIGRRIAQEILKGKRAEYGETIVSTLSRQLGWSHFKEIIYLKQPLQREFYAEICRVEQWSVRTLQEKISGLDHNHSKAFYSLLNRCQPDWRKRKEMLDRFWLS